MEQDNISEESVIDYIVRTIKSEIESEGSRVIWIPNMDDETIALLGTWKKLIVKALKRITEGDPFDYVIEITAQPPKEAGSNLYTHAKEQRMIAEKLGILDEEDGALRRLLESQDSQDELDYYMYLDDHDGVEQRGLLPELDTKIYKKLRDKKYILVFEHLDRNIQETFLANKMGLPVPSKHNGCWWLISTLSHAIVSASKSNADIVLYPYFKEEQSRYGMQLLRVEAHDILSTISLISCREEERVLDCLFYSFMFTADQLEGDIEYSMKEDELVRFWEELDGVQAREYGKEDELVRVQAHQYDIKGDEFGRFWKELDGVQDHKFGIKEDELVRVQDHEYGVKEDELVRFWVEEGFITELTAHTDTTTNQKQEEEEEEDYDYNTSHLFNTGKAIMDKFITRSLLRRRHLFIIPTNAMRIFNSKTQIYGHDYVSKWWFCRYNLEVPSYPGEWEYKKHISLFQLNLTRFPLSPPPRCQELTTLILRGCSQTHNIPDDFFQYMPLLRILDLSYTDLTFIPSSVSHLHHLRLLTLRGCQKLTNHHLPCSQPSSSSSTSIPSQELHPLLNLHVLDVSCTNIASLSTTLHMPNLTDFLLEGCTALLDPPPFLPLLNKLRVLRLTGTQITTFPESTFSCMEGLRVLDLSNNHHLVSLPGSMYKARLLEELHITDCRSLMKIEAVDGTKLKIFSLLNNDKLTSLPEWFSRAESLEKLHLQNCRAMEKINIAGNASMRSFFLSGSPIVELSLRGCKNLETIELLDLEGLEVLDLSFTRINELPANIFNDLPKLRYFCMVGAQNLRRFPWHQIQQLPKEFIFDHCSCHVEELNGQIIRRRLLDGDDKARAHIFVDDPRFFWSLKEEDCQRLIGDDQVRRHILEFHVTICPCERRCSKEEEARSSCRSFIQTRNFPYKDIYSKRSELIKGGVEQHRPNARLCSRHLTMEGGVERRLPGGGNFRLLDMIESLSISEDRSVVSLSDMSPMNALKECMLTQCHNMECVVVSHSKIQQKLLEILWVSGLGKLTTLFSVGPEYGFVQREFGSLRHAHIEHCPRLEKLFPNNEGLLPSLETLTIKFCDSLREITYTDVKRGNYESVHPRLHTLILLELPKLLHFREDPEAKLPSLKTLHVRGCWRLRRLPLLLPPGGGDDQSKVVEVSGERKWWNKLTWDHYPAEYVKNRFSIRFKPQAKFYGEEPTIRGRSRNRSRSRVG